MADETTYPVYKRGHTGVFGHATHAQIVASNGVLSQTPHGEVKETTEGVSGGADGGGGAGANPPGAAPPITQGADGSAAGAEGGAPAGEGGAPAGEGGAPAGEGLVGEGGADPAKVKKAKGA